MAIAVLLAWVGVGCGDDGAIATGSASETEGSSTGGESSVTLTSADSSSGSVSADSSTATTADTSGTTTADTSGTATDATTTDTDSTTDTDGTTGDPVLPGRTQSQLVGVGERMSSATYQMVFTLGQPTQHQSTHTSPNFRLQGGLVGANGSPP